eukprot:223501-Amphidinium_carterae.2
MSAWQTGSQRQFGSGHRIREQITVTRVDWQKQCQCWIMLHCCLNAWQWMVDDNLGLLDYAALPRHRLGKRLSKKRGICRCRCTQLHAVICRP